MTQPIPSAVGWRPRMSRRWWPCSARSRLSRPGGPPAHRRTRRRDPPPGGCGRDLPDLHAGVPRWATHRAGVPGPGPRSLVQGVSLLEDDEHGRIKKFTVMIRPLSGGPRAVTRCAHSARNLALVPHPASDRPRHNASALPRSVGRRAEVTGRSVPALAAAAGESMPRWARPTKTRWEQKLPASPWSHSPSSGPPTRWCRIVSSVRPSSNSIVADRLHSSSSGHQWPPRAHQRRGRPRRRPGCASRRR